METVGDKYMAVSGLPEVCNTHAKCIANLALDLMDVTKELRNPNSHLIEVSKADTCRLLSRDTQTTYVQISMVHNPI